MRQEDFRRKLLLNHLMQSHGMTDVGDICRLRFDGGDQGKRLFQIEMRIMALLT